MKISLNWLRNYIDIQLESEKVGEILTEIGLEVEGIDKTESIKGGLKGVVVGEVIGCEKHPNADKLSLTQVDIGGESLLQIVCGAPNVAAGQKVMVATVGTTLYDKEGNGWTIKDTKIRGASSSGMICAEDELGLGDDHSGIIVLEEDVKVGTLARDFYQVTEDTVYEIGLTPNRSDATSHIGVAKDLAAALKINYLHDGKVTLPDLSGWKVDGEILPIKVRVENEIACPRYSGVTIKDVKIGESPTWLKTYLESIDVRPINNVVDITNYVLHEYGQPLHAFDYNKIQDREIIVKTLPSGTSFHSLDEQERILHEEDLMICDGQSKGMCIGGVFGGLGSGVVDQTTNIFLESAHFNAKWIRRSNTRHLLFTDAAKVFEKGSDPNVCVKALKRAAMLIQELADGKIASEIIDIYPNIIEPIKIFLSYAHLDRLVGVHIRPGKVKAILAALEMSIHSSSETGLTVGVPTSKVDVTREADLIEEVLRIYGFNNIPFPGKMNIGVQAKPELDSLGIKNRISDYLVGHGFHEMMALSMVHNKYFDHLFPISEDHLIRINNTSNIHTEVMRPNLLISGLEAVVHNQNRQQYNLKLFEFGKGYQKHNGDYDETDHLSLLMSGRFQNESWLDLGEAQDVSFYTLKSLVLNILQLVGIVNLQKRSLQNEFFSYGLEYHRGKDVLVELGKVSPKLAKKNGSQAGSYLCRPSLGPYT